jgi:CBS-domain-containing membrane protein
MVRLKNMKQQYNSLLKQHSFSLSVDQMHTIWMERFWSVFRVLIGVMLAFTIEKFLGEICGLDESLMAFLGASASLSFALLASPKAQPVYFGNVILRSLHPPVAMVAKIVVLGHVIRYLYTFFPVMVGSILWMWLGWFLK